MAASRVPSYGVAAVPTLRVGTLRVGALRIGALRVGALRVGAPWFPLVSLGFPCFGSRGFPGCPVISRDVPARVGKSGAAGWCAANWWYMCKLFETNGQFFFVKKKVV